MDLVCQRRHDFWQVTFPFILPGVIAAAMLAFSLSIDDYVVTLFTAGQTSTFPLWVYGAATYRHSPVQVNAMGTLIFVIAVGFVVPSRCGLVAAAARARESRGCLGSGEPT